jgi:hypothetical protein
MAGAYNVPSFSSGASYIYRPPAPPPPPAPPAPPPPPPVTTINYTYSASTWGVAIPLFAGKGRLPGNVIWLKNKAIQSIGGVPTASFAVAVGEPLDLTISRTVPNIWAAGKLIYTTAEGLKVAGATMRYYDGTQTAVDPAIAADTTATPVAYIHTAYVVFENFPLTDFGNQLPAITPEFDDSAGGFSFTGLRTKWDSVAKSSDVVLTNSDATATCNNGNTADGSQPLAYSPTLDGVATGRRIVAAFRVDAQPNLSAAGPTAATQQKLVAYAEGAARGVNNAPSSGAFLSINSASAGGAGANQSGITGALNATVGSVAPTDIIMVAIDTLTTAGSALITWGRNGTWGSSTGGGGVFSPGVTGAMQTISVGSADVLVDFLSHVDDAAVTLIAYPYTPPSGFTSYVAPTGLTYERFVTLFGAKCGYSETDFIFVGDDEAMIGVVIAQDMDFKTGLASANRYYGRRSFERGSKIVCSKRVSGSTFTVDVTLTMDDLIALDEKGAVQLTRADPEEVTATLEIQYIDDSQAFHFVPMRVRRPQFPATTIPSHKTDSYTVPIVDTASSALDHTAMDLYRQNAQRDTVRLKAMPNQRRLEPCDIIAVPHGSRTLTVEVISAKVSDADASVDIEGVKVLEIESTGLVGFAGNGDGIIGFDQVVLPGTGNVTVTGHAPTVTTNVSLSPSTGHVTVTGHAPTIQVLATWNPSDKSASVSLSSGNSIATNDVFTRHAVRAGVGKSSGKWAFRVTPTIGASVETLIGIATSTASLSNGIGLDTNAYGYNASDGSIYKNSSVLATYQTYSSGQPVDVACDFDNGRMWVRRNGGNWNNSGTANPATNTGGLDISALTGTKYPAWSGYNVGDTATLETFTPMPSGFSMWA